MRLDGKRQPARVTDGGAEQHVVRKDQVGRHVRAQRGGVECDVACPFVDGEILQQLRLHTLVPIEHENGEQPADVRTEHLGSREVVTLGMRLLADHDDVVAGAAPFTREGTRVDVGSSSTEQVAVPEQDPHGPAPCG